MADKKPKVGEVYELFVTNAEHKRASSGTRYTNLSLIVRSDVEQNGKGWTVYHNLWKNKDGSYDSKFTDIEARFNMAVGVSGEELAKDPEKWAKALIGKPLRSKLKEESYNGKTKFVLNNFSFEPSEAIAKEVPPVVDNPFDPHGIKSNLDNKLAQGLPLSEDDLPF